MGKKMSKKPNPLDELKAEAEESASDEERLRLKMDAERARQERSKIDRERKILVDELKETQAALRTSLSLGEHRFKERKIVARERKSGHHEATAVMLCSDLHPDEVVLPETVNGLNEFDKDIAEARMERLAIGFRWMLECLRSQGGPGFHIRDVILALLGDMISNTIHPELAESNSMMPADALVFVGDLCVRLIDHILEDPGVETLSIPCCHGNHDRMTVKQRHSTRAGNSLATILYHHLAKRYESDKRVQFTIARGNMTFTSVYDHDIRWTHGDDIRYGGGVGGVTIPARKKVDAWNQSRSAWLTCWGHFHHFIDHRDFVQNGSLIGWSPYAQGIGARWEPAQQVMFLVDKSRGKRMTSPILVQDGRW